MWKNHFDKKQQPDKEKWTILKIHFLLLKQNMLYISSIHIRTFCPEELLFAQPIERSGWDRKDHHSMPGITIQWLLVLVLGGREYTFSTVVCMGLFFVFVTKTVLATDQCFTFCQAVLKQHEGFLSFSHHPVSEMPGGKQEAGMGHRQNSWAQVAKGIFHTICHHAQW